MIFFVRSDNSILICFMRFFLFFFVHRWIVDCSKALYVSHHEQFSCPKRRLFNTYETVAVHSMLLFTLWCPLHFFSLAFSLTLVLDIFLLKLYGRNNFLSVGRSLSLYLSLHGTLVCVTANKTLDGNDESYDYILCTPLFDYLTCVSCKKKKRERNKERKRVHKRKKGE